MTDHPLRSAPLDALPRLDPERCSTSVFADPAEAPTAPLLRVASEGRDGLVSTTALRFELQDRSDPAFPLRELVDEGLWAPDEAAGRALVAEHPELEAVGIERGEGGGPAVLLHQPPDIALAVVMAGGLGTRLRPLTESTPKPLLEVGGRPLLFHILDALAASGVRRVRISIHYLGEQVREAVGDGSAFGLEVGYLEEREPLGTGAGLAQLGAADEPFLVVNGDLLTGLDFRALGRFHRLTGSLGTVATHRFAAPLPYGVVEADDHVIEGIREKPVFEYPVNAGIYAFDAAVLEGVTRDEPLAMVDFLNHLAESGGIARFPVAEPWSDVGSPEALARARAELGGERAE